MAESQLSVDAIIDRRALRRRVTFWRVVSLALLALAIIALLGATGVFKNLGEKSSNHIARVSISGVITNDKPLLDMLDDLKDQDAVKAVILDISSPGGSTVGGEAIYEAVRELSEEKPVVTSVGTLAASAGYMIASASDYIVARRSSIVGSIGVIFQYGQVSKLLDKIGVEVSEIKSAPLKAEPSPFHPASEEAKEMISKVVLDSYEWFVSIVGEQRKLTPLKARQLADGSVFSGSQGLENGLVDAIGNEETARKWLVSEKEINDDLEIVTWKPVRPQDNPFTSALNPAQASLYWLAKKFGFDVDNDISRSLKGALPERLFLDGLISMMQINYEPHPEGN